MRIDGLTDNESELFIRVRIGKGYFRIVGG